VLAKQRVSCEVWECVMPEDVNPVGEASLHDGQEWVTRGSTIEMFDRNDVDMTSNEVNKTPRTSCNMNLSPLQRESTALDNSNVTYKPHSKTK